MAQSIGINWDTMHVEWSQDGVMEHSVQLALGVIDAEIKQLIGMEKRVMRAVMNQNGVIRLDV